MLSKLLKKILLILILLAATSIQVLAQFDDFEWGTSKNKILSTEGKPNSKTGNSLIYLDTEYGMKIRTVYVFDSNELRTGKKEFYGFKKADGKRGYKKFTYDDNDELEDLISDYFKINEKLTAEHGEPLNKSIPLSLKERYEKLDNTFDAYPTPSISDDEVELIDHINVDDSNSKRLKEGKIKYSTTWSKSSTVVMHLLYNNNEDRPLGYGNLHHQIIYSHKNDESSNSPNKKFKRLSK